MEVNPKKGAKSVLEPYKFLNIENFILNCFTQTVLAFQWSGQELVKWEKKRNRAEDSWHCLVKMLTSLYIRTPSPKSQPPTSVQGLYSALSAAPPPALTSMTRAPATFPTSDSGHSGRSREQMGKTKGHSKFLAPEWFSAQVNASPLKDK